jgi:S-adenosylmethionine synthetase
MTPMTIKPFTSESVTEGHPDKMADQISDAVLDEILAHDPYGRVACETLITTGFVCVAGEISTKTYVDIPSVVRRVVTDVGYTSSKIGFDGETCGVAVAIQEQSADITAGVNHALEERLGEAMDDKESQGAGDQGMMFGFACRDNDELMPMPIWLAHRLARRLAEVRKAGVLPYLRPDGKIQVTIGYENGKPVELDTVVCSCQHQPNVDIETLLKPDLMQHVIEPLIPPELNAENMKFLANPTGVFEIGGPRADTGLTGRKIIIDTYGGMARHGGGAFSGKDPSKVDRSAAYACRYVAKNVVAAGLADRFEIQVAYAIGVARPISISIDAFGTETVPTDKILDAINEVFDLRPAAIIEELDLLRPIYRNTAAYGHFGRSDKDFTWEQTDRAEALQELCGRS